MAKVKPSRLSNRLGHLLGGVGREDAAPVDNQLLADSTVAAGR